MAGNEIAVCEFLILNLNKVQFIHIGRVEEIAAPVLGGERYIVLHAVEDLSQVSTSHSGKKADIYLNGRGISIKQSGGSFAFNRLQRANLLGVYTMLGLTYPESIVTSLDHEVNKFHQGLLPKRNQPWQNLFSEEDFKTLIQFLILKGSPNLGISSHPAEFILEAPQTIAEADELLLWTFEEYFEQYKSKLEVAIRRQWVGQESDSEHSRAVGIASKSENLPWVFDDVVGQPKPHKTTQKRWRDGLLEADRKTVYFLMIEKKK
ncbi:MAG: hypothetical protein HC781_16860 [Leptolyngbyaceae cyanobacterium CSU_1_4]|nr:hypothetical protein [Leptolyngbyaceae cyanobacterium CSU_1_4]